MDYIEYYENELLNDYYDDIDREDPDPDSLSYEDGKKESQLLYGT